MNQIIFSYLSDKTDDFFDTEPGTDDKTTEFHNEVNDDPDARVTNKDDNDDAAGAYDNARNSPVISERKSERAHGPGNRWWEDLDAVEQGIKNSQDKEVVKYLQGMPDGLYRALRMKIKPSLVEVLVADPASHNLFLYRENTASRHGENVLHAAVLNSDVRKMQIMFNALAKKENEALRWELLDTPALPRDREGTIMEGEYPLSVAALKLNKEIVEYLLKLGADVLKQNSNGDNVIHSLIRYASVRPEKMAEIRDMMGFIYNYLCKMKQPHIVNVLFTMENNTNHSPLHLAVEKSTNELCTYILSLKKVYLKDGGSDGVYEKKIYDITDLDSFTNREANKVENAAAPKCESVIEMIFADDTDNETALELVKHEIISYIINLKWKSYLPIFLVWMACHFAAMIVLTAYSIVRVDFFFVNSSRAVTGVLTGEADHDFVIVAYWLMLVLSFVFFIPIALFIFSRTVAKPRSLKHFSHNVDYFILYVIFVACIIIDAIFIAGDTDTYNGEALIFSVLCGWLFSTMFLRAIARCGHLTVLVRRVIIRDIFAFVFVFAFLIIAFSACLHDLLKYKTDEDGNKVLNEDFSTFGRTLFQMFHAMLGLTEISGVFDARSSWLAIMLLITFLLITYALLVNALIGIITSTCEEIFANKRGYMNVHKLSVLIFMEEFFALFYFKEPIGERVSQENPVRYILEIKSETNFMNEDDKVIAKEKEERLRIRDSVYDALQVSETIVFGYKCVDCKRREMILAANKNADDYRIRQKFMLDSEGRPISKSLKA